MEKKERPQIDDEIKEFLRIPSIGELSARALLGEGFESISQLKDAGLESIRAVEHIGARHASDIYMEIQKDKIKEEPTRTNEFECPGCSRFVRMEDKKCSECGRDLELESKVILPERGEIGNIKETLVEVEQKIWKDEEEAEPWFVRGAILESIGAKEKALEAYDKVIELDPLYEHIWNAKAALSLELGKNREAARAYKIAFDTHDASEERVEDILETPLPKEEKKIEFEKDEGVKKAEKKISKARSAVKRLADEDIDRTKLISLLDKATEGRLYDEIDIAVEKAKEAIKKSEHAQSFAEAMKDADERLAQLKEKDEETYQRYRERLDELEKKAGFKEGIEKIQRVIHEIDEIIEGDGKKKGELSKMIEEGKRILNEKRDSHLRIGPLKEDLKEAIKKKKKGEFEEGIDKVKTMQKKAEIISEIDELLIDLKERLKDIPQEEVAERVEADMKDIIEESSERKYEITKKKINDLFYALEREKKRPSKEKSPEEVLRERISRLKDLKDELSKDAADMIGVLEGISSAEKTLQEGQYKKGIKKTEWLLANDDLFKDISTLFEKVKSKKKEFKEILPSESSIKKIEERIEGAKQECRDGEYEDTIISFRNILEDIEENLERKSEKVTGKISELIDEIEEILERGKEKGIDLTDLEEELEKIEEDISESDKRECLERLKNLQERGKSSLIFIPIVSEIEREIQGEKDSELEEYRDELEKLKDEFENGKFEDAIEKGKELKEEVSSIGEIKDVKEMEEGEKEEEEEGRKEEVEDGEKESIVYECPNCGATVGEEDPSCDNCGVVFEEEEVEEEGDETEEEVEEGEEKIEGRAEEVLDEAKENLANLRGTKLEIEELKKTVKRAKRAKKEGDHQKARNFAERAIKASDDLEEILELCHDAEKKLNKLTEKGLMRDKKSYERELERYRRATSIGVYEPVKKNLEELVKELDMGLEKEKEVPVEEEDKSTARKIKEKISELKELQGYVKKSGIDIQINKRCLKEAIPKVKSKAYQEAFDILFEGEKNLLEKLDDELKDRTETLEERINSSDLHIGENRVHLSIDEIERRWRSGEHRAALKLLLKVSNFVRSLEESESKIERQILTVSQIIEDMESSEFDIVKEKESLREVRDMDKSDEVWDEIKKIKDNLSSKLNKRIKEEVKEVEEKFKDIPRKKVSSMLGHLIRAESGRKRDSITKMALHWKKYTELLED